jgi:hypothetical protein
MSESNLEIELHNQQQWAIVLEARLQPFVKSWLTAGKKLTLTCKLQKRTAKQNRRYWGNGILSQIAAQAESGGKLYSAENWHEVFKRMYLGVDELPNGQVIGKSSTGLTTAEFCEFSDKVEAYAATELFVVFVDLPVKDLR